MDFKIIQTEDGSSTIYLSKLDETYHSIKGAIQESNHVFIKTGLLQLDNPLVKILEIGFGTGLNALLTLKIAEEKNINIEYTTIEKFPIEEEIYKNLSYSEIDETIFLSLHKCEWEKFQNITDRFKMKKVKTDIKDFRSYSCYDLIYFDAFSPSKQPEMWEESILSEIVSMMNRNSIFVTYCAKGEVRRTLQKLGLKVERLPGPPGKREIIRGVKIS